MSGFIRRFTDFPPQDVLAAIEGINIIDLPPPGQNTGVSTQVVCLVGEFADMTYAVAVSAAGVISTSPVPQEIVSGQDLLNKVGGFDPTIGAFGVGCGNGYVELRNKSFGRLIVVPVNLASASGVRLWRELPTNKSATDPTPIVPTLAAQVTAGRLFKSAAASAERMSIAARNGFAALEAFETGTDGSVTAAGAGLTGIFTAAAGLFTTIARPDGKTGVQVGDILALGVISAGGAQGANARTYRVRSITDATNLVVERLDGTSFTWTTGAALVWRLHPAASADSYGDGAGSVFTSQGSFDVPVRPLTNGAGTGASGTDGTWAVNTSILPLVAPPSASASTWDPLSGLQGAVGPTTAVAYTAAVQRPNAPNAAGIDALYTTALASLLQDNVPAAEVEHTWCARKSTTIASQLRTTALNRSAGGRGMTVSFSPELNQNPTTVVTDVGKDTYPGVGTYRDERFFYDWPPVKTFVPEAVGVVVTCADGTTTVDGILDVTGDGWMASIMGSLAPERNPGESSATTQKVLAPVLGYARGVPSLDINAWEYLRLRGIAGIRMDRTVGPVFQSGITTSLTAGQKNIARRKMADFIEDSIAEALRPFCKLPQSRSFEDSVLTQTDDFLSGLLSVNNSAAQRIAGYLVDGKGGNTPALQAAGFYVVIVKVRTIASADFIVIQAQIGEGVVVTSQVT